MGPRPWPAFNYLHDYFSLREARQGLDRYFPFDNHDRPHQALGYRMPAERYPLHGTADSGPP
ncbi:integrase core domain-containing protein [Sulfobacillus thermosulfidooxidans]|uniref:integrase core domain-containing protein n=1 Tax=Sulfobacillus thermosulfidooxidans TaxID=28034 RepID=UPI0009E89E11